MIKKDLKMNVVEAAQRRILDVYNKHEKVLVAFSGGKDSICLADLVVKTFRRFGIPFERLIVMFFDEEAMFPDVVEMTMLWRRRFLALGAKFYWFCLPIKHYNCCNKLVSDESFICWEPGKEDKWVRRMPKFAIRWYDGFKLGMSYQDFLRKVFGQWKNIVGVRMSESMQRQSNISSGKNTENGKLFYPMYDWTDNDVWLYIRDNNLELPVTYIYLYKVGTPKNQMRISQFFSIDTIKRLAKVMEYYPNLYQDVVHREPNADLVMLYHDTTMFRSSKQDREFEQNKDYKKLFWEEWAKCRKDPTRIGKTEYNSVRVLSTLVNADTSNNTYKKMYSILIAGDPKCRVKRVVLTDIRRESTYTTKI